MRASKASELARRARSELLGFNSFTIEVENPMKARAAAARKSTRGLMSQREELATCTATGPAGADSQQPPFASPIASRGAKHRFGFSGVAPATGTDPGVHAGVLLPGGRYDVALAQAEERIQAQRLRDAQALKQQRVEDAAKKLAAWRRAKEGPSRVDVASLFDVDKLVGASQRCAARAGEGPRQSVASGWRELRHERKVARPTPGSLLQGTAAALVKATSNEAARRRSAAPAPSLSAAPPAAPPAAPLLA